MGANKRSLRDNDMLKSPTARAPAQQSNNSSSLNQPPVRNEGTSRRRASFVGPRIINPDKLTGLHGLIRYPDGKSA